LLYNKQNKAISPKKNSLLTPILPPQNQPKKELQSMPPFKFAPNKREKVYGKEIKRCKRCKVDFVRNE
jgi:hypothetical protein